MPANIGYATDDAKTPLGPREFDRQPVGAQDVRIDIKFCGVCHSDVHQARDEFGGPLATNYPCMPGHEIAGLVVEVGAEVSKYSVGDRVGVGCMIYWGAEEHRDHGDEQYQTPQAIVTYNAKDPDTGEVTFGGYSDEIIVNEHFVLRIPDSIPLEKAAPILCSGVTTWSPLQKWNVGAGKVVGIAGLGGLGHIAVQIAKARGADKVIALTRTPDKRGALLALGADDVLDMTDDDAIEEHASSIDFLLSTIPTPFDMKPYVSLIAHDGALVTVGMLEPSLPEAIDFAEVSTKRISIGGSFIGSIAETQEILDFCAKQDLAPEVEIISIDQVNDAFDKIVANDVRFRYVIDNSTLAR